MTGRQTTLPILMVDDNPSNLNVLRATLEQEGYRIAAATSGPSALKVVPRVQPVLILLDVMMPGMDGFEVCRRLKEDLQTAEIPVIFITAREDAESVVRGFEVGGVDYITKPFREQEVLARIRTHLAIHQLSRELREKNRELREAIDKRQQAEAARKRTTDQLSFISQREARHWGLDGFIGRSPTIAKILDDVSRLRQAGAVSVLITGESGTGKELIARAIHFGSQRRNKPFIPVNCSAIPRDLAESELFGHVRGAFTGATGERKGHFELADGGTLFLDEIGDMPLDLQTKLLRVLEDGCVTPVGGSQRKQVDVRILSATNIDLPSKISDEKFRGDLYYRLAQFTVVVPPLRDRREDIPLLAEHFTQLFSAEMGMEPPILTEAAEKALIDHPFPGNVRELKNLILRALIESQGQPILTEHLRFSPVPPPLSSSTPTTPNEQPEIPLPFNLAEAELQLIQRAIEHAGGNITRAAELLGINRKTIYRKLRETDRTS